MLGLRFELNGITYLNNTVVDVNDIGIDTAALLCITDNTACCSTNRKGEFYYPNGSAVPIDAAGSDFYRNRGDQVIRLHGRNSNARTPLGKYRCELPDSSGLNQTIYINIYSISGKFRDI